MPETVTRVDTQGVGSPTFPAAPSLALTFVFAGIGFAFPLLLFPETHPLHGPVSSEILNLNFLVAWMGLAHFVFAYKGQFAAIKRHSRSAALVFFGGLAVSAAVLLILRSLLETRIFDFLVWIYFIPHFIKAELFFARSTDSAAEEKWVLYWFPALAFAFLTYALFGPRELSFNTALLLGLAFLCVLAGGVGGIQKQLVSGNAKYALLGFFFIGEALVWGTYSKYMTPQFRQGVYVFHIAVASFYHYFRSYGFALRRQFSQEQVTRYVNTIVSVNVAILGIGLFSVYREQPLLQPVFDVTNFTFWVGLHLVASDLFGFLRSKSLKF
ncbi:MAG: hypothetical protein ACK4UN_10100 [Limisphaerales bacterium]